MPEQDFRINLSSLLHKFEQLHLPSWQLNICPSIRVGLICCIFTDSKGKTYSVKSDDLILIKGKGEGERKKL